MKVLVTGGLGYLGSVLVEKLLSAGLEVKIIDINYFGLPNSSAFATSSLEYSIKDMRDFSEMDIDGCDAVVHLASISNDPVDALPDSIIYGPSVSFTERLARICTQLGIHMIFPSSCSVYGIQHGQVREGSDLLPQTGYSRNKVEIENILISNSTATFKPTILRLATVYGYSPSMRFDTVINMLVGMAVTQKQILLNSNGLAWRPFVHINDVVEVIYSSILAGQLTSQPGATVINVGRNQDNARIIDVSEMIQEVLPDVSVSTFDSGRDVMDRESVFSDRKITSGQDSRSYRVNFDRLLASELNTPETDLTSGIARLVDEVRDMNMQVKEFKDFKYYRLQQLESLKKRGIINDSLEFIVNHEV